MITNVIPEMYNKIAAIAYEIDTNPELKSGIQDSSGLLKRKSVKKEKESGKNDTYSPAYKAGLYFLAIHNKRRELLNENSK